jgi:hypothetical protein
MNTLKEYIVTAYGGLPVSNAEKRKVVEDVLRDPRSFGLNDKDIAEGVGCSPGLVHRIRRERQSPVR